MKLWARFTTDGAKTGAVRETFAFDTNPHPLMDPSWLWVEAPAETVQGSTFDGTTWNHGFTPLPEPTPDPEPTYRLQISPAEFRNMFTAFEEVDIKAFINGVRDDDTDETKRARAVVGVLFDRLLDPRLTFVDLEVEENIKGLMFLRSLSLITAERYRAIAKGIPVPPGA